MTAIRIILLILAFILILTLFNFTACVSVTNEKKYVKIKYGKITIFNTGKKRRSKREKKTKKQKKSSLLSQNNDKISKNEPESKKKNSDKKTSAKPSEKESDKRKDKEKDKEKKSGIKEYLDMFNENKSRIIYAVRSFVKILKRLFSNIRITDLTIDVRAGDFDAYECADKYIRMSQAVYPAVGLCASLFYVKKKKIEVTPCFGSDETRYNVTFNVKVRLIALLSIVFIGLAAAVKIYFNKFIPSSDEKEEKFSKKTEEIKMKENSQLGGLMGTTMEKIKEMVDVNTIIGEPIHANGNVTVIPVSKVSYGFGAGGSDLPVKNTPKDMFGGGTGAGISIKPIGFLVIQGDDVKLLQVKDDYKASNSVVDMIPGIVDTISSAFSKGDDKDNSKKKKKTKKSKEKTDIADEADESCE